MNAPALALNPRQDEAVHHLAGPCLVLAGAGSGKTRVIVHKIARLLQAGLEPRQIAAITFTNKAAQEMRERAKALVGPRAARDLAVSTFHSLGVRMLRSDGTRIGLKENFSILDSDDVLGVLRDCRRQYRQRAGAALAVGHQPVEEPGPGRGGRRERRGRRRRTHRRARHAALRGAPGGLPGGGLRRPHRPAAEAAAARRRGPREVAGAVPPHPGRRGPGHQRRAVRTAEGAGRRRAASSPRWATTTRASTAGAAPPSRT